MTKITKKLMGQIALSIMAQNKDNSSETKKRICNLMRVAKINKLRVTKEEVIDVATQILLKRILKK